MPSAPGFASQDKRRDWKVFRPHDPTQVDLIVLPAVRTMQAPSTRACASAQPIVGENCGSRRAFQTSTMQRGCILVALAVAHLARQQLELVGALTFGQAEASEGRRLASSRPRLGADLHSELSPPVVDGRTGPWLRSTGGTTARCSGGGDLDAAALRAGAVIHGSACHPGTA